MKDWISTAKEYEKYKQQKRGSNAMSEENLLSRWGQGYDHAHRGEDGYISLSQRWKDLYQRVVDYYNDEESYNNFYDQYSGVIGTEGYVGNTDDWYTKLDRSRNSANSKADELLAELNKYSRYYNEGAVSYVRDLINERKRSYDDIMSDAKAFRDHWSQWATEDDYDNAVWENELYQKIQNKDEAGIESMISDVIMQQGLLSPSGQYRMKKIADIFEIDTTETSDAKWYERLLATVGDFVEQGKLATGKTLETIGDGLGRGYVAAGDFVNNLLDGIASKFGRRHYNFKWENWKEDYLKDLEYNWAEETYGPAARAAAKNSYLAETPKLQNAIHDTINGVVTMAPAVALNFVPGGQPLAAGYMSALAFGGAVDDALAQGDDLDQAVVYGQAIAGLEAGSDIIGGSIFGGASEMMDTALGRWIVKSGADDFFGKGLGKGLYTFVSEGLEESIMDVATPLAQSAFDIGNAQDTYFGKDWKKGWSDVISGIPKTFAIGGTVGSVIDGFHSGASALSNKDKGGFKYNKIADEMTIIENTLKSQEAVKQSKNATPEIIYNYEVQASKKIASSVENISNTMQSLTAEQRQKIFENAPILEMYLNADGSVREEFRKAVEETYSEYNNYIAAVSAQGAKSSNTQVNKLAEMIGEKNNSGKAIQGKEVSKLVSGISKSRIQSKIEKRLTQTIEDKGTVSIFARALTNVIIGESVSNGELRKIAQYKAALKILNEVLGTRFKVGVAISDIRAALSKRQNNTAKLSTENILGTTAAIFGMDEAAEKSLYTSYASDVRNTVDGKAISPEEFAAAYGAVYAAGKKGQAISTVNAKYTDVLSNSARETAYRSGERAGAKNSEKDLSNGKESDTMKSTQSRRENSDGKVGNDTAGRRNDQANDGKQSSGGEKEHRGDEGIVAERRLDGGGNPKALVNEDSAGRKLTPDITLRLSGTAIVDSQGRPIQVVHSTDANFDTFEKGDIGFHFGSDVQAQERAKRKNIEEPVYVRAYLNIKNPVKCTRDIMSWQPMQTALNMWDMGIITLEERSAIYAFARESGGGYNSPAAIKLREILESKGYDGIAYPNGFEGEGTSYIAFHDEQIVRVDNGDTTSEISGDQGSHGAAIRQYKSSESYKINEAIRSGRELTAEESAFTEELDRDLEKTPKYSGVTYRNISFDMQGQEAFDAFVAEHVEGGWIKYPAYTSTSKSKTGYLVDGKLTAHIEIYGENGHDISKGYGIEEEQEVLYERNSRFVVKTIKRDGNTVNIVLEGKGYGRKEIQGSNTGNTSRKSGSSHTESNIGAVQQLQTSNSEKLVVQGAEERNTRRDSGQRSGLQGVRGEVSTDAVPDVQQAKKENSIDHERVVYSSKKAVAYDAIPRGKLDAKQKRVADVAEQIGLKVIFATTVNKDGVEVDGFIAKNGDIYINPNRNVSPMEFVFKHELAHFSERAGQKYQDFKNLVRETETFKKWLADKGMTERAYVSQIVSERAAIGQKIDEASATAEIMANFVGDMLFNEQETWAEDLSRELDPKQKKTVQDYIRGFFKWIKSLFVGEAGKAKVEVHKIEKAFGKAFRAAAESNAETNGEQFAFSDSKTGRANDTLLGYNAELAKIISDRGDYIVDSFSKLQEVVNYAFDHPQEKATAYFGIIDVDTLSRIEKSIPNMPKDSKGILFKSGREYSIAITFDGIRHIVDGKNLSRLDIIDYLDRLADTIVEFDTVTYDVYTDSYGKKNNGLLFKKKFSDGTLVSFDLVSNKKRSIVLQTLYLDKANYQKKKSAETLLMQNASAHTPNAGVGQTSVRSTKPSERYAPSSYDYRKDTSINSISNSGEKNNSKNAQNFEDQTEQFSYTPQNEKIDDVLDRVESGELTLDEARKLLKKPEGDTPASIANLKPEDMGTTPHVNKKSNGNVGDGDSRFSESVKRSSIFDEDFKKEVAEDNFVKHYAAITNKETLAEAAKRLDQGGEAFVTEWLAKKAVHMDTVDTMVGFILLKRYQDVGNYEGATAVAQKIRDVGTLSGQRVQAFSIIGRFDADMMQAYAQKELDKAWELAIEGRSDAWIEKHREQFKLTDEEISFIRDNILYAAKMPENSRERAIALAQITSLIQNKIPPVRGQGFKAWQRVSMLLNPKTQIRNVLGNAMMAPVFVASDFFSSGIDKIVSLKTNKRTTGITARGAKAAGKGFSKGLYESLDDFRRNIDSKHQELDRYSIGNGIRGQSFDEHTQFKALNAIAKKLNALDDITSHLLDIGDRPFFEMWYMWSLNNQMVKNNVDIPTLEMMDIATEEALERTWQNDTTFSKVASKAKHVLNLPTQKKLGYGLGDVLIKFTKTPANIARAIYEYSPVSFVSAISSVRKLRRAFVKGEDTSKLQKQFVSRAGKAFTGCVIYGIIAALYAMGHIAGAGDEDDDAAAYERYIQGIPDYSIKSGDKWITYDWAQPLGAYVAIVAEFLDSCKNGDSADTSIKNAISAGGGVLMDQSFMSSIQEFFAGSPDGEFDIFNSIFSSILDDVSAMVPTLFSQIASFTDDKKRVTYDNTSEVNTAINRILIKIPGLRRTLEADVDVFGREIPNSQNNFYDAFLNAGNMYSNTSDDITDHAYEIYKSTGDVGAIPAKAPYSVKYQNQSKKLTDEERAEYQRVMGGVAYDMIDILLENEVYLEMSDNEKLAVLKEVYSYSAAFAKNEIAWYDSYEVIHGIADYITESDFENMTEEERIRLVEDDIFKDYKYMNDIESDEGMANYLINKKTPNLVLSATLAGDIDEAVKLIEGIEARVQSYGWSDADVGVEVKECRSDVKTAITRYWKWAYTYAKEKGDTAEMERIEEMIKSLGLYVKTSKSGVTKFDDTLFDTWLKDTEKDN